MKSTTAGRRRSSSSLPLPRVMIAELSVRSLFGSFDYDLSFPEVTKASGISFLYGENGCGKTTILDLILHLLSPEPFSGHRTAIARVPFKRVAITVGNGAQVIAEREGQSIEGPFVQRVILASGEECSCTLPMDKKAQAESANRDKYLEMCNLLVNVDVNVRLLSHDRLFWSSTDYNAANEVTENFRRGVNIPILGSEVDLGQVMPQRSGRVPRHAHAPTPLQLAMARANSAIIAEATASRDSGTMKTDTIYSDLVKRLARQRPKAEGAPTLDELKLELRKLATRSASFELFGLTPRLEIDGMLKDLEGKQTEERATAIVDVLQPYVSGLRARLDALQVLRDTLEAAVKTLSRMYLGKDVSFSLLHGFKIQKRSDESPIDPNTLSSGEQQLLLLACTALACRQHATILMIDEPELSLNVTWQQPLMGLLQSCLGPQSSLLIATHSLEVLSQYRSCIVRMNPKRVANDSPEKKRPKRQSGKS